MTHYQRYFDNLGKYSVTYDMTPSVIFSEAIPPKKHYSSVLHTMVISCGMVGCGPDDECE